MDHRHETALVPAAAGGELELRSAGELASLAERRWDDLRAAFASGRLESHLDLLGEFDLSRLADALRAGESDADVGLQRFLEESGTLPPPPFDVVPSSLGLGTVIRGEVRTFRVRIRARGSGILHGEAWFEGAAAEGIRPIRAPIRGRDACLEFTLYAERLEAGRAHVMRLRIETNGGTAEVPLAFTVAPRPGRPVAESDEIETAVNGGGFVRVPVRNAGDAPVTVRLRAPESWIEPGELTLAPGARGFCEARLRVDRVPPERIEHRRKGDAFVSTRLQLESDDAPPIGLRARIWLLGPWDRLSAGFGLLVGLVPFLNLAIFGVLLAGLIRGRGAVGSSYRAASDRRDSLSFALGMVPSFAVHAALILWRF